MILGGSDFQIPLILAAKKAGLFVITCDYLPDNPGHKLSDQYIDASTTDKQAVLQVAINNKIDAIATFASDPAVPTVAFVAEALNLPGISALAAETFSNKDQFRQVLQEAQLKTPEFFLTETDAIPEGLDPSKKYIIKPVDASGSKGVRLSDATQKNTLECISYALSFSRSGKCIIEEYIEGPQIHGDGFFQEGKLIASYFGDHYFYTATNSFIPISTRWPTSHTHIYTQLKDQLEKLSAHTGYLDGPINVEARVNSDNEVFIIEVGARNGGNFVPIIQRRLTGFDYVDAVLKVSLGQKVSINQPTKQNVGAHYILHSESAGSFDSITIDPTLQPFIFYQKIFKQKGAEVEQYCGSHTTIGVLLLEFPNMELKDQYMDNINNLVEVVYE
jgi:biotin carboxylase